MTKHKKVKKQQTKKLKWCNKYWLSDLSPSQSVTLSQGNNPKNPKLMQIIKPSIVLFALFAGFIVSLTGCHSVSGNVIPQSGPSMEQVYDSMGGRKMPTKTKASVMSQSSNNNATGTSYAEENLNDIRRSTTSASNSKYRSMASTSGINTFHKLPNPELKLYVYPHLAGQDEVPIPGYYTEFNAYAQTHYALPSDTTG